MKFKYSILIVLGVLCISLISCKKVDKTSGYEIGKDIGNVLDIPDKIIIYNREENQGLDKNDSSFNEIVNLTNKRFHSEVSTALDMIEDNNSEKIVRDGIGVEFIYSYEQELNIKGDGFKSFKYNKLYFQLTSEKNGNDQGAPVHWFIHGDSEYYKGSSNGPLKYSKELVNLVEDIIIRNTDLSN